MIISLVTRFMIMLLGYLYPAYECFKIVEQNRPELESLRFWCQYWIIVALVTVVERVGDPLISWVPMYSEAKLAFFVYLWYPKTRGTAYFYSTFVRPFVSMHEHDIDRNLNELRATAGVVAYDYWVRGSTYFQARFYELLQYLASQSASASSQAPPAASNSYPPRTGSGSSGGPGGFAAGLADGLAGLAGLAGVVNQPSAPQHPGTYPVPPPGMTRQAGPPASNLPPAGPNLPPSAKPPPAAPGMYPGGVAGPIRQRSSAIPSPAEDEDDFHFVDRNPGPNAPGYFPEATAAPTGYQLRSRQRTGTDRPYPPP